MSGFIKASMGKNREGNLALWNQALEQHNHSKDTAKCLPETG